MLPLLYDGYGHHGPRATSRASLTFKRGCKKCLANLAASKAGLLARPTTNFKNARNAGIFTHPHGLWSAGSAKVVDQNF